VWEAEVRADGDGDDGAAPPGTIDGRDVATGAGVLCLVTVQPEGKGRQDAAAWRNGTRPEPGERLGA
jgi:methionyl-tRNA formyltransferase